MDFNFAKFSKFDLLNRESIFIEHYTPYYDFIQENTGLVLDIIKIIECYAENILRYYLTYENKLSYVCLNYNQEIYKYLNSIIPDIIHTLKRIQFISHFFGLDLKTMLTNLQSSR